MLKKLAKKAWYKVSKHPPAIVRANILVGLLPKPLAVRIWAPLLTGSKSPSHWRRFWSRQLNLYYYSRSEEQIRQLNRELVWGSIAGRKWHQLRSSLYTDSKTLLTNRGHFVSEVSKFSDKHPQSREVVEIGTGHGLFLELFYSKLSRIERFIGLDINAVQIDNNRERENTWPKPGVCMCRSA
ncbi:MAG: class I SAM-dependent methyltransferase [SAR202 cluster bacterium]|nr:class I SAM-dependent methyltransferase [SAR202 cluster bacterium]